MKNSLFILILLVTGIRASAQLTVKKLCPPVQVRILEGNVNGLEPNFTAAEIKKVLPCFTSEEPETDSSKCGGIIAYKDIDLYFYTGRDYVEIGEKFIGKLSIPLMGAARSSMFSQLGYPKVKDAGWDAFQTQYGILILYYNKANKVNKIQFSKKTVDTIKLCE